MIKCLGKNVQQPFANKFCKFDSYAPFKANILPTLPARGLSNQIVFTWIEEVGVKLK